MCLASNQFNSSPKSLFEIKFGEKLCLLVVYILEKVMLMGLPIKKFPLYDLDSPSVCHLVL